MHGTSGSAVLTTVLCFSLLVVSTHSYDFGSCPELSGPIGIHPSSGDVVPAGRFEVTRNDEETVVTTLCDESSGWILADTRFQEVRCSYDKRRQVWSWSHQHRSQINPPQIRCSSFSPRPLEQSYTLHNYQGCNSDDIRASLTSQVSSQLETALPCRGQHQCVVPLVQCRGEGGSSKLSVVVEATMLGSLDEQRRMLADAAQFLRDSFKPVFSSGGINKRDVGNPFDNNDPDNTTTADCVDGQKTVKINTTYSYCVDCTAGTFVNKTDPNNEECEPCPYDSYSANKTNAQCTQCAADKGTLLPGSDSADDCKDVCKVPNVDYTSSTEPAPGGRVLEGETVTLHCDTGFYYGNRTTSDVTCNTNNNTNNNFPASCRKITVRTPRTSIEEGSDVRLTCEVDATGPTPKFTWYKAPTGSNQTEQLSIEGVTSWSSALYNISHFRGKSNGHYYCKPDYDDPILDDMSKPVTLSVLDVRVNPIERAHVYTGDKLNLTCTMRIDPNYPKRTIEWTKFSTKEKIVSGFTTSETDQSYQSVLTLYPLKLDDTDYYICSANYTNTEGNETIALDGRLNVIVRGFVKEPDDVSVLVGKEFLLGCELFVGQGINESNATLNWEKFDELNSKWIGIDSGNRSTITQTFNDTSYVSSSTLKVDNASLADSGRYKCITKSKFKRKDEDGNGDYLQSIIATVTTYDLGVLSHPEDRAYLVGETAELSCKVAVPSNESDHVSVQWLKVTNSAEELLPDERAYFDSASGISTLILHNVSMTNASNYKCKASYVVDGKSFEKNSSLATLYIRELSSYLEEYSLIHIPFYYDDEDNMYNKTDYEIDNDRWNNKYNFSCMYHGDENVEDVFWTVKSENGTVVEFLNENGTEFHKGSYNNGSNTWLTKLQLTQKFITVNYNANLTCQFNFSAVGKPITSTTNIIVHATRPLDSRTLSSNTTINITCNYVGTDEPDSMTWLVDGSPLSDDDSDSYTIHPEHFDRRLRFDVLTVSDRTYSDRDRNISCKYSFSKPRDDMQTFTLLIYRGMHSGLLPEYYLAKDHGPVVMECQLGVGADGSAPYQTSWYFNDNEIQSWAYWVKVSTDTAPTNGLFKSALTVSDDSISSSLAGNYSCSFEFMDDYVNSGTINRTISSQTILHTRMPYRGPMDDVIYGYSPDSFPLLCLIDSDETPDNVTWSGPSDAVIDNAERGEEINNFPSNGTNVTVTYYFLNLTLPSPDDSGPYSCTFNFESGPSVQDTFPEVRFNDIKITNPSRVYATASGVMVKLECKVESHELLELGWYDVDFMDWITPTNTSYDNVTTVATYNLEVNSVDDKGNFTCVLDEEQYSKQNVSVVVLDLYPGFSDVVVGDEGEEVSISCRLDYNSDLAEPIIEWFQDGSKYDKNITSQLSSEKDKFVSELKLDLNSDIANKTYHCVGKYSDIGAASDLVSENVTILMTQMVAEREYVIAAVNDNTSLTCIAYSKRPETIFWRITKDGKKVNVTDNVEHANTSSQYVSKSVLRYTDIQMNESSDAIECWFQPEVGDEKSATITLDVLDVKTTGREVKRGQPATLKCSATPSFLQLQNLAFKWFYTNMNGWEVLIPDNETLSGGGKSELTVTRSNDTEYTCVVYSNVHANSGNASREVSYYVFDITNPKDVTVEAGDLVSLTCGVLENNGTLSFSWYKEGNSTSLHDSAGNSTGNSTENSTYSTFTFTPDSFDDTGSYYCEVTVEFDGETNGPFESEMAYLIVREVRPSFKNLTLVHNNGEEMTMEKLECKYYGDLAGLSLVEWETPAGRFSDGDYAELIQVEDIRSNDSYISVLSYNKSVNNNDEFFCDFNMRSGDLMRKETKASVFSYTELYENTYNPIQINFTYTGEVESKVTWLINGNNYDGSTHPQFTPSSEHVNETSTRFLLEVDMSQFNEGTEPVGVKGMIGFESENVTLPYPEKYVTTRIYKRDFIEKLDDDITTAHNEAERSFSCLVAGENNNFTFSWFIGNTELLDEDNSTTITDEVDPVNSKNRRKSTLTIRNLNTSPLYNDELRCVGTWEEPETFSVQSVADLDTVGASMDPRFFTQVDGSAVLTCLVWGNDPPKQVVWTNEKGEQVEHDENRIEIKNETVKTQENDVHVHTLTFVSLQQANEGRYTCAVTFEDDEQKNLEADVNFIGASFEPESPYFVDNLNETIQFTCSYKGFREPKQVIWFKDSEDESNILSNSSVLYNITTKPFDKDFYTQESIITMKRAKIESSGEYICKWETDQLNVSATMVLAVRTLKPKAEVFYSTDGIILLECEYRGQKEGAIEWFYESELITEEDERTSIEKGNFENSTQTFNLTICEVSLREDAGRYSCVLSFQDGDEIRASTKVVVRESKILSDYMSTSDDITQPLVYVEDDMLEMQCQLEGDKIPNNVQWFYKGTKINFDGRSKTVVNAVLSQMSWGVRYFSNVTIKGQDNVSDGNYTCKFSFFDKDEASGSEKTTSTTSHATVLGIDVTANKTCTFVDYQKEANASLGCSFEGEIDSVDVELKTSLMYLPNGKVRSLGVSETIDYTLVNVSNDEDGIYKCAFVMNSEGNPEFFATQRLTARKAMLRGSRRKLVSGTTLTLNCTVPGGSKSISWYKDDAEISGYKTLDENYIETENGLIEQMSVSLKVRHSDTDSNTNKSYTCRGEIYDEFCPQKQEFDSAALTVEVIPAEPLKHPSDGFAYQGESHEFTCQFPDAGDGEPYNVYWMFNNKRILTNGDYYENGKRVIDGEIKTFDNSTEDDLDFIESRYRILAVDSNAKGEYKCGISWRNGVVIKSDPASLTLREISLPPLVTNVVLGTPAKLSCSASGDIVANITFYKLGEAGGNSTMISGTTQTDNSAQSPESVVTEGEVTLTADDSSPGYYYCKVTWDDNSLPDDRKEITSEPVYLNVFTTYGGGNDTWGVLDSVVRVECLSDAALKKDENGTSYLDENSNVVFAEADVTWMYKGPSESVFKPIDGNIKNFTESPWIGFDGYRRSGMIIGPIEPAYADYEFKCAVNYDNQEDKQHNFFGGITFSKPTKLKISSIQSFTSSENEVIVGESFNLTCTAIGEIMPAFRITNDGRSLDISRYIINNESTESRNNLLHITKYEIQTNVATVLQGGQDFYCSVDFGSSTPELVEKVKITTNYDCRTAKITVLGKQPVGQKITYEDDNGNRTARVKCPDDTDDTRYSVYESTQAKSESVCTKETGFYDPPYLATCLAAHAFESGSFEQVWSLSSAGGTYCTDNTPGQFSKTEMTKALTTDNSQCGPYPIVPCLKNIKCTLNVTNTGCRWDDSLKKLHVFYQVDFQDPVWTIQKRKELTNPQSGTKIKFWDCPESLQSPNKRTLTKRGKLLERMVADQDSDMVVLEDQGRNYSALGIGIAGFIAAAILVGAFLYKRRYSRESPDIVIGTVAFEMTDRSLVVTNRHSS